MLIYSLIIFTAGILCAWAFWLEPSSLQVQHVSISLPHEQKISNLRIGIASDTHIGRYYGDEKRLEKIVDLFNQENPDIIVFLGDFVAQKDATAFIKSAHVFKKLKSRLGQFAVLGNHDWWAGKDLVIKALEMNSIQPIDNKIITLKFDSTIFQLVGFGDYWEDPKVLAFIKANQKFDLPSIGITHNPDIFPETNSSLSLMLAGHTHGGQVNFPLIGAPIVPSKYKDRYRYGIISENNHHLFVTSGTGNSILPVRFRVPPEIVILDVTFN